MVLMVVIPGQVHEANAWHSRNVNLGVGEGVLDSLSATSSRIIGHGWHAITTSGPLFESVHFIFVMDKNTGLELARYLLPDLKNSVKLFIGKM